MNSHGKKLVHCWSVTFWWNVFLLKIHECLGNKIYLFQEKFICVLRSWIDFLAKITLVWVGVWVDKWLDQLKAMSHDTGEAKKCSMAWLKGFALWLVCNSSLWAESKENTALNQVNTKTYITLNKNIWLNEFPVIAYPLGRNT